MSEWANRLQEEAGSLPSMRTEMAQRAREREEAKVVAIARDIGQQFAENERLPQEEQLPYAIFEDLADTLQGRLAGYASESLLAELRNLPVDPIVAKPLIDQQIGQLIERYDRELEDKPADLRAKKRRGELKFDGQDWEGAAADLTAAAEVDPADSAVGCLAVRALLNLSQHARAMDTLGRLLDARPDAACARRLMAAILAEFGYSDLAEPHARFLEKSSNPDDLAFCATFRVQMHEFDKAQTLARRALEVDPSHREARRALAQALFEAGAYTASITEFSKVLELLEPDAEYAHIRLQQLEARRFIANARAAAGGHEQALEGYLDLMAAGDSGYLVRRGYAALTLNLLQGDERREEKALLTRVVESGGAAESMRAYGQWLSGRGDKRIPEWIEENMTAEFSGGLPKKVLITDLEAPPYLERLPWVHVVQRLEVAELIRDSRRGFHILFRQDLPALRQLRIRARYFGAQCARELLYAPFFSRLESLALIDCNLNAAALEMIVGGLPAGIRSLELSYANAKPSLPVPRRIGDRFLESPKLAELQLLDLTDCSLATEDVEKILASRMPRLRVLILTSNDLSDFDAERLIALPVIRQLQRLSVGQTGIEKRIAPLILDRLPELSLESLGLHGDWDETEVRALKAHPNYPRLKKVEFGD